MNPLMKNIAKSVYHSAKKTNVGRKSINMAFIFRKYQRKFNNNGLATKYLSKNFGKIYTTNSKLDKGEQLLNLVEKIDIEIPDEGFIFSLDGLKNLGNINGIIDNISVDYSRILDYSLNDYKELYMSKSEDLENSSSNNYIKNQLDLIKAIELLIDREVSLLNDSNRSDKSKFINYLENIKDKKADSLEEALQRILLFNQLLWQTGHGLNGLGRLDKVLDHVYTKDKEEGLDEDKTLELIKEFLETLHSYYWYKSAALMGDTGQVIILGGNEEDGTYFYNDLTILFIKVINELQLPDPKILLRVSSKTPQILFDESVRTINSGVGSPLLSNDDVVINEMIDFGYDKEDAYNYVVSACWEPSAVGKGLEQNNINFINFLKPLNRLFDNDVKFNSFDELLELYKKELEKDAKELIEFLDNLKWETDPILSLFIDDCNDKLLDISQGGAKYNHYGITTVSLANTVNSLYNLKKLVFEDKKYSFDELNNIRKSNFENENILNELKNSKICFGIDNDEILNLANEIINYLEDSLNDYNNSFGGKIKFGLSAPSYISAGEEITASFDGRKNYEPFSTHISSDSSDYTEMMRFASKLDYSGSKFNGNVVDLMASPNFIEDNFEKFRDFLILSGKLGYFQMQMNVVDSETLIKAKENPELYSNLIVRVWGFSAYFNDLPLSYKDLLIDRALRNESKI